MKGQNITMAMGAGGYQTQEFLRAMVKKHLGVKADDITTDSFTFIPDKKNRYNFTSDMFVVSPLFFRGGDIGTLAVSGTVNDLLTGGSEPRYLSLAMVLEEGFSRDKLLRIVTSIRKTARTAGITIVTGDTKVVRKGECDGCFICTSGIGRQVVSLRPHPDLVKDGDDIIISGTVGDHSVAIMEARGDYGITTGVASDCAPLTRPLLRLFKNKVNCKFMRDPTRGGLAAVLNELAMSANCGIELRESRIPVRKAVRGFCDITGFDHLGLANEGKMVIVLPPNQSRKALRLLRQYPETRQAVIIGRVTSKHRGTVVMSTVTGSTRIIPLPAGELLPRIC